VLLSLKLQSKPTFGFVFVIPPKWHAPQVALNKRLPRLTCSGVNTIVLPAGSATTVRVASSKSIAEAVVTKRLKMHKNTKEKVVKTFKHNLKLLFDLKKIILSKKKLSFFFLFNFMLQLNLLI
jgi:hypothetical protein